MAERLIPNFFRFTDSNFGKAVGKIAQKYPDEHVVIAYTRENQKTGTRSAVIVAHDRNIDTTFDEGSKYHDNHKGQFLLLFDPTGLVKAHPHLKIPFDY